MFSPRSRALVTIGVATFLVGAPRAFETDSTVMGSFVTAISTLTLAGLGLAVVGLGVAISGLTRARLAGGAFIAGSLAMLPIVPIDAALPLMFLGAAVGGALLATARQLAIPTRLLLGLSAASAALLAVALAPASPFGQLSPLLLATIVLGLGIGPLVGATGDSPDAALA